MLLRLLYHYPPNDDLDGNKKIIIISRTCYFKKIKICNWFSFYDSDARCIRIRYEVSGTNIKKTNGSF